MKAAKLSAVFMISVMALAGTGIAYAAWYDSVSIEATVHMGDFITGWLKPVEVNETTNGVWEGDENQAWEAKPWVADTTVMLTTPETSVHHTPKVTVYKKMYINVSNAYPQYDAHIIAKLKNAGTIPGVICPDFKIFMYDEKDNHELQFRIDSGPTWVTGMYGSGYEIKGAVVDPVVGDIINFDVFFEVEDVIWQIDPCNAYNVTIDIDFKQAAEECHTYTFTIDIVTIQWNKDYQCPLYT
jgi:predicted ribosomally synthesized peptide with SipW-like signal peptide